MPSECKEKFGKGRVMASQVEANVLYKRTKTARASMNRKKKN